MNWINLPALEHALLEYDADSAAERIVLLELYYHSDERGYTYPSVKGIARRWGMHPGTARARFSALLAKKAIFPTKKRRGNTGQIKVYRLPESLRQRGTQTAPSSDVKGAGKGRERGWKGANKGMIRGTQIAPNIEHRKGNIEKETSSAERKEHSKPYGQPNGNNDDDVDSFWGEYGRAISREIKELTKPEGNSRDFTHTWERRIKEKPEAVKKAMIITQRMVREGKKIRSIGGALNSNYEQAVKGNLRLSYEEEKRLKLRREMDEARASNEEKRRPRPQKVKAPEAAPAVEEKPSRRRSTY